VASARAACSRPGLAVISLAAWAIPLAAFSPGGALFAACSIRWLDSAPFSLIVPGVSGYLAVRFSRNYKWN